MGKIFVALVFAFAVAVAVWFSTDSQIHGEYVSLKLELARLAGDSAEIESYRSMVANQGFYIVGSFIGTFLFVLALSQIGGKPKKPSPAVPPSTPQTSAPVENDVKTCPYCAETIKAAAIVCRYCGRDLPVSTDDFSSREEKSTAPQSKLLRRLSENKPDNDKPPAT